MMINFFGWEARRRVAVLVAALLTAVALQVLRQTAGNGHALRFSLLVAALPAVPFILGAAVAGQRYRPAWLVARPEVPALDVPANPSAVLGAAGYTFVAVHIVGGMIRYLEAGPELWFTVAVIALVGGQQAALWRAALGRFGVRLTPAGITDRQPYGDLFIPWDALDTAPAAFPRKAHQVALRLARPDLVRKRGFRGGDRALLPAAGVDAQLLASTINGYADRTDARIAIGS
ncbi:hypothetical protein BJY16_005381 [Actinoplanes octamycinicus]|uniref:Uncharacterized protein n=1 Tax=Actinoplanes octamycinicus TaxID=135948 RepID=A0A7W7H1B4_9ACTN|nr:hypothetical protein [Actinoplanes octamycinicus]MBB4741922.1 hypothetical protein [Actinoplanes octamycinicus]GIE60686.1 hypothetical protein Aoc01nite_60880 [Actinoplanes octamycinicus]